MPWRSGPTWVVSFDLEHQDSDHNTGGHPDNEDPLWPADLLVQVSIDDGDLVLHLQGHGPHTVDTLAPGSHTFAMQLHSTQGNTLGKQARGSFDITPAVEAQPVLHVPACYLGLIVEFPHDTVPFGCMCALGPHNRTTSTVSIAYADQLLRRFWEAQGLPMNRIVHDAYVDQTVHQVHVRAFLRQELAAAVKRWHPAPLHLVLGSDMRPMFGCSLPVNSLTATSASYAAVPSWLHESRSNKERRTPWLRVGHNLANMVHATDIGTMFGWNSAAALVLANVLDHLDVADTAKALHNAFNVLRPGGLLVVATADALQPPSVPAHQFSLLSNHRNWFTHVSMLKALTHEGFEAALLQWHNTSHERCTGSGAPVLHTGSRFSNDEFIDWIEDPLAHFVNAGVLKLRGQVQPYPLVAVARKPLRVSQSRDSAARGDTDTTATRTSAAPPQPPTALSTQPLAATAPSSYKAPQFAPFGLGVPQVLVVNLARRQERWLQFVDMMAASGLEESVHYQRFDAVDGYALNFSAPNLVEALRWRRAYPPRNPHRHHTHARGVVGCALSHANIWHTTAMPLDELDGGTSGAAQHRAQLEREAVMVLEDDVVPRTPHWLAEWQHMWPKLREDDSWDLLWLGFTTAPGTRQGYSLLYGDEEWAHHGVRRVATTRHGRSQGGGTFAYLLRRRGAAKLRAWVRRWGIQQAVDRIMIDLAVGLQPAGPPQRHREEQHGGEAEDSEYVAVEPAEGGGADDSLLTSYAVDGGSDDSEPRLPPRFDKAKYSGPSLGTWEEEEEAEEEATTDGDSGIVQLPALMLDPPLFESEVVVLAGGSAQSDTVQDDSRTRVSDYWNN